MKNIEVHGDGEDAPEVPSRKLKDGGFFARPQVRMDLAPPTATEVPVRRPEDFCQVELLDVGNEEPGGVRVYISRVVHPSTNEGSDYIVMPDVVAAATAEWEDGDATYAVLTEKVKEYGGEVRVHELYPWISRTGQFGLWSVKTPLPGNKLSEHYYFAKTEVIRGNAGKWVRYTMVNKELQVQPAPGDYKWRAKWPAEYLNGDWESIINRAFRGQVIKSLEDQAAKWLAGII
jgi:hypothetical protein